MGKMDVQEADFVPVKRKHAEVTNADIDPFHTNNIEYTGPKMVC